MRIYLVSEGSYSDWSIIGLYSTKEKAEEAKEFYATSNTIDEWDVDAPLPDHPPGTLMYSVSMKRNGEVGNWRRCYFDDEQVGWYPQQSYTSAPGTPPPTAYFNFTMWTTDEDTAIKIANERRLACIADGRWTGTYSMDNARWQQEMDARRK